ncbi:MAG: hypothetical protein J0I41_07665 [Filimonas sp.]|nr:hypothetical protein [Filimonas sp.]
MKRCSFLFVFIITTLFISCKKQQEFVPTKPFIDSITPLFANEGDVVAVYGKYFNGTPSIIINDKVAKVQVTGDVLHVTVPGGAFPSFNDLLAKIQIKASGIADTATAYFYSAHTPRMYSIYPTTVHVGDTITITGAGFVKGRDDMGSIKFFPPWEEWDALAVPGQPFGTVANIIYISDTIIKLTVPVGTRTGILIFLTRLPVFIVGAMGMDMAQPITIIQ